MPVVRNVTVKDATHNLAQGLNGNLEAQELVLEATAVVAGHFKKGAVYTATDGHHSWKVVYKTHDGQYIRFHEM
jgi:photosystem II stability/assembly factor-like uncharacterized protein